MKRLLLLVLMIGFLINTQAQEPSDKIVGIWLNSNESYKIEIYKAGATYSGKIVWLAKVESKPNLQPKDKNNPKPELRNRYILGLDIITRLHYVAGKWVNGTIYTPKRGMYADCEVELPTNGQLKIIVSKSGFSKTQIWTRK